MLPAHIPLVMDAGTVLVSLYVQVLCIVDAQEGGRC